MLKKQLIATRFSPTTRKAPAGPLIMDSDTVVAAIAYHLVDDGMALSVDADSIQKTRDRLRLKGVRPCVSRGEWAAMTNDQRLKWLLIEGHTCAVLSAGVAALVPLQSEVVLAR